MIEAWYARPGIVIDKDPYIQKDARIWIDDAEEKIIWVDRFRDGGTTRITTDKHVVVIPCSLKDRDRNYTITSKNPPSDS